MKPVDRHKAAHTLADLIPILHRKLFRPSCLQGKCELTPLQFISLMLIIDGEAFTMTELAEKVQISKQQMTPIMDKLVSLGFVERVQDGADRRIINLVVTLAGEQFLQEHLHRVGDVMQSRMSELADVDVQKLARAVEQLAEVCEKLP